MISSAVAAAIHGSPHLCYSIKRKSRYLIPLGKGCYGFRAHTFESDKIGHTPGDRRVLVDCSDVAAAVAFYSNLLGLAVLGTGEMVREGGDLRLQQIWALGWQGPGLPCGDPALRAHVVAQDLNDDRVYDAAYAVAKIPPPGDAADLWGLSLGASVADHGQLLFGRADGYVKNTPCKPSLAVPLGGRPGHWVRGALARLRREGFVVEGVERYQPGPGGPVLTRADLVAPDGESFYSIDLLTGAGAKAVERYFEWDEPPSFLPSDPTEDDRWFQSGRAVGGVLTRRRVVSVWPAKTTGARCDSHSGCGRGGRELEILTSLAETDPPDGLVPPRADEA